MKQKKIAQIYRKELRKKMSGEMLLLKNAIRKKPRFVPKLLWGWIVSIVIKEEAILNL